MSSSLALGSEALGAAAAVAGAGTEVSADAGAGAGEAGAGTEATAGAGAGAGEAAGAAVFCMPTAITSRFKAVPTMEFRGVHSLEHLFTILVTGTSAHSCKTTMNAFAGTNKGNGLIQSA
jgi:hypothetical protein